MAEMLWLGEGGVAVRREPAAPADAGRDGLAASLAPEPDPLPSPSHVIRQQQQAAHQEACARSRRRCLVVQEG